MPSKSAAYLEQVKDAIAEAHNKHAGRPVVVHCCHLCPSLIEEVFSAQSPSASYITSMTDQPCTPQAQSLSMPASICHVVLCD